MASKNKQVLQSNPKSMKEYSYTHGNVRIEYSIQVDIKDHLTSLLIILEKATADAKADLDKVSKKN